jgi:hypothetical protein
MRLVFQCGTAEDSTSWFGPWLPLGDLTVPRKVTNQPLSAWQRISSVPSSAWRSRQSYNGQDEVCEAVLQDMLF